jgi:deoxycytidylate deaminase
MDRDFEVEINDGELIFGLVAPVGVDLDTISTKLENLIQQYNYSTKKIHLSKLAEDYNTQETTFSNALDKIHAGMQNGSRLRQLSERDDFFAILTTNEIYNSRVNKNTNRNAFIVRSFKRPEEIDTMRRIYGCGFYLLGITSSKETRTQYLKTSLDIKNQTDVEDLIDRDYSEKHEHGQRTRDAFQLADVFINLDNHDLDSTLSRFIDLIFGSPNITPTAEEHSMFMAYMSAIRSGDLSRQVGAVITSENNDIISTGANDVQKFGGGQYWPGIDDNRDHTIRYDANEKKRDEIILNVLKAIEGDDSSDETESNKITRGKKLLKNTGILDLTEYGRAVHAEMDAILTSARNGVAIQNATLYTTTFPCHNCAKHIVAAGIKTVKFIEPYPKSYATILHSDSIDVLTSSKNINQPQTKVYFEPFVGVGPRRYMEFFSMSLSSGRKIKRKKDGDVIEWHRGNHPPRAPLHVISYIDKEEKYSNFFKDHIINAIKPSKEQEKPICIKCGSVMDLKTARRGKNIGAKFWGCINYPDCTYTKSVE